MKITITLGEATIVLEDDHIILDAISTPAEHLVPPAEAKEMADELIDHAAGSLEKKISPGRDYNCAGCGATFHKSGKGRFRYCEVCKASKGKFLPRTDSEAGEAESVLERENAFDSEEIQ